MTNGANRSSLLRRIKKPLKRFRFFHRSLFIRAAVSPKGLLAGGGVSINRGVSPPRLAVYTRARVVGLRGKARQVSNRRGILITQQGRFGNSYQQVTNAIRLAEAIGIRHIFLEPNEWLKPEACLSSGLTLTQLKRSESIPKSVTQLFVGRFLWSEEFDFTKPVSPESEIGQALRGHLSLRLDMSFLNPKVLVVHLRGGDVFSEKPARDYGQPPIGFYQRIFMDYEWERIHIVHEDSKPVVLKPLLNWCSSKTLNVTHQSSDLRSDLEAILGASNLVVGNGSFGRAACHLNPNLNRVFRMDGTYDLGQLDKAVTEISVRDSHGQYVKQVLSSNWKNSDAQRALMLDYSANNFEIVTPGETAQRGPLEE